MARIIMQPEIVLSKSIEVRALKQEQEQIMHKINNLVNELALAINSEAHNVLVDNIKSMESSIGKFSTMLEEYAKLLETHADMEKYIRDVYAAPDILSIN